MYLGFNAMCVCLCTGEQEKNLLVLGWIPGLTACQCRVLLQYAWRAELKFWKLNLEQDSVMLFCRRAVEVPFGTKLSI